MADSPNLLSQLIQRARLGLVRLGNKAAFFVGQRRAEKERSLGTVVPLQTGIRRSYAEKMFSGHECLPCIIDVFMHLTHVIFFNHKPLFHNPYINLATVMKVTQRCSLLSSRPRKLFLHVQNEPNGIRGRFLRLHTHTHMHTYLSLSFLL